MRERALLEAARGGDEHAFRRLVEPHRARLYAHCHGMLGSVHDAEDALQEALLRAWRGLSGFQGRSSLRTWLYRIATNACLDAIEQRRRRPPPGDDEPRAFDPDHVAEQALDPVGLGPGWIEPLAPGSSSPASRYERRESLELACAAALRHLPAKQRAALILRDALGLRSREVAEALETTTASVNSALQRARQAVSDRVTDESGQATPRSLGDGRLAEAVGMYVRAIEQTDVEAMVALVGEDPR